MQNELLERNCKSLLLSVPTILEFVLFDCVFDISIPNLLYAGSFRTHQF
jgi:hypothetical protein